MATLCSMLNTAAALPPRRKRAVPRILEYNKCAACRKTKLKCIFEEQPSADKTCQRCRVRSLECTGPQRAMCLPSSLQEPQTEVLLAHDALILLSLQYLIQMALDEMCALVRELLGPFRLYDGTPTHPIEIDHVLWWLRPIINNIKTELKRMPVVGCRRQGKSEKKVVVLRELHRAIIYTT
ncbi:hypothetical protein CC86DRAFT_107696 [Ophiobolus disseminans]|uniref:Zn(2)-C6 fungal-type domain-containing protein n=1 Tax=Ophiobolus disseminans TaxID=1469910 RepID=A0A6A6ZK18_9PLEO|nr:hypothetical protein CC86DRAFT_107696 [Ophiobolus disseminans]